MRNRFEREMEQLQIELTEMGSLCEQVITGTCKLLENGETIPVVQDIVNNEKEIDRMERRIEDLCMHILMRQQPVARDLRQISAAMKMITDMERVGDQASDIAEIVKTIHLEEVPSEIPLVEMGEKVKWMVTRCVDAFVRQDTKIVEEVLNTDDLVDEMFVQVKEQVVLFLQNPEENREYLIDLLMIAKYYERIGDHATNIAEWVAYSITGEHNKE